jgi:hypothetical protein
MKSIQVTIQQTAQVSVAEFLRTIHHEIIGKFNHIIEDGRVYHYDEHTGKKTMVQADAEFHHQRTAIDNGIREILAYYQTLK